MFRLTLRIGFAPLVGVSVSMMEEAVIVGSGNLETLKGFNLP